MKLTRRPKPCIEQLEQRDCPSYVLRLAGGTLYVTGRPTGSGQPGTVFLQKANDQWQVTDGTNSLGTYNAANIYLSVAEHQNTPITFNLNGHTDGGNITVNLGTGDNSNKTANATSLVGGPTAGTLGGNFTVLNGSGDDDVFVGFTNVNGVGTSSTVNVGGDVDFYGHSNPNLKAGGNQLGNLLDTGFNIAPAGTTPTVRIGGSVNTVAAGADIATLTTVGRDVTITSLTNALQSGGSSTAQIYGNVGRNVTITGSAQSSGDIVFIGGFTPMQIGGNLSISTPGNQTNIIEISNVGPGTTIVNGNTFIRTGDGTNLLTTDGVFNGNLTLQLGNGVNTDTTTAPGSTGTAPLGFFPSDAVVNGNLNLTAGNGANNFTTAAAAAGTGAFAGEVDGNTNIVLGNGNDSPFIVTSPILAGKFNWTSGNGADSLSFANTTPASYNVNVQFGNANDSFGFNGAAGSVLSGRVDGGGRLTIPPGNQFFQGAGDVLAPNFILSNFP